MLNHVAQQGGNKPQDVITLQQVGLLITSKHGSMFDSILVNGLESGEDLQRRLGIRSRNGCPCGPVGQGAGYKYPCGFRHLSYFERSLLLHPLQARSTEIRSQSASTPLEIPVTHFSIMVPKWLLALGLASLASAQCPFADGANLAARAEGREGGPRSHLEEFEVDDDGVYLTSDVGGPMEDQESLKAGERGPTLLEDFIFRQKITHFDHERVSNLVRYSTSHI